VLSILVASGLLIALVVAVHNNGPDSPASQNPTAVAQANQEAEIVVAQDQAPHALPLAPGIAPAAALSRAVRGYMAGQIRQGDLNGPLQRSSCTAAGRRGGSFAFRCTVLAADVSYPFLGVVDLTSRRVTYCKRDPPPVPSENIPVSRRCRV
jgi:hypothetical protein